MPTGCRVAVWAKTAVTNNGPATTPQAKSLRTAVALTSAIGMLTLGLLSVGRTAVDGEEVMQVPFLSIPFAGHLRGEAGGFCLCVVRAVPGSTERPQNF